MLKCYNKEASLLIILIFI